VFPKSNSTIRETGVYLGQQRDMIGRVRHNPPSIGAYEYVPERPEATVRGVR